MKTIDNNNIYNPYNDAFVNLEAEANANFLNVEIDAFQNPIRVNFSKADPAQLTLLDEASNVGNMILTYLPDKTMVDLNLCGISNKDLSSLIKKAEKAVQLYLYCFHNDRLAWAEDMEEKCMTCIIGKTKDITGGAK